MVLLKIIVFILQFTVLFFSLYAFFMAAGAIRKYKTSHSSKPLINKNFAILISARNEETVIGQLLYSLQHQKYPKERFQIYVVADNCTDRTADVAKEEGAIVYERFSDDRKTKGYALKFLFDKLEASGKQYDAYIILDADNIVAPFFLSEMTKAFNQGYHAVQGFRATKNPDETWLTRLDHISESAAALESRGRRGWGLSCGLKGSAMAFSSDLLRELGGWKDYGYLEDIEMQANCALHGFKIAWWPEAIAYDEKLTSMRQVSMQRSRWLAGNLQVLRKYLLRLLRQGIKTLDPYKLEQALYISRLQLPRSFLILGCLLLLSLSPFDFSKGIILGWGIWLSVLLGHFLYLITGLAINKAPWRMYLSLILGPAFILMWLNVLIKSIFTRKLEYQKANHTSKVTTDNILPK